MSTEITLNIGLNDNPLNQDQIIPIIEKTFKDVTGVFSNVTMWRPAVSTWEGNTEPTLVIVLGVNACIDDREIKISIQKLCDLMTQYAIAYKARRQCDRLPCSNSAGLVVASIHSDEIEFDNDLFLEIS